ncbi:MAG: SMP-30/gluconolactonase/LRE family protein [Sphingomonadaceae bacterium]
MTSLEKLSTGHGTLEGPLWDAARGLLFADATVGGVRSLLPDGRVEDVVLHRRGIGGLALHADGGVVIGGRNVAVKRAVGEGDDTTIVLLDNDPGNDVIGFNDLAVDAAGRVYIGSLAFVATEARSGKTGSLFVIDLDGTARVIADDVQLTNGLGFSPDGRTLYHSDSMRHVVYAYDVRDSGDVGPRRTFVETGNGMPDGLVIDNAGTVWVALPFGGEVIGYDPAGRAVGRHVIDEPMVTSMCFGGLDLRDFYIVSGSEHAEGDRAGSIYRTRVDVPGQRRNDVRIRYR